MKEKKEAPENAAAQDDKSARQSQSGAAQDDKTARQSQSGAAQDDKTARQSQSGAAQDDKIARQCQSAAVAAEEGERADADSLRYKNGKEVAKSGLLGFFIGLAVIVPGISGSTVAVIFRLYRKLLFAIGNLFKKFRKCAAFLAPIVVGIAIVFVVGFFAIQRVIEVKPFAVVALFAGLMAGAFPAVKDEIRGEKASGGRVILFLAGVAVPIAISLVSTVAAEGAGSLENLRFYHYLLFLVLGYIVAVTQIVPGLSATAILMVFGYFSPIMESVHLSYWRENPQVFLVYLCLVVGFAAGLFTFSKVLNKIFEKKKKTAFFAITGLSLGSVLTMFFNPDIYAVYKGWAEGSPMLIDLLLGILLFAAGAAAAYAFVRYERKKT